MRIAVNAGRIAGELETLASFSDAAAPAVTRIVFTPSDMRARAWIKGLCDNAGLRVREDAVGNTFARWRGSKPDLPAVATGSHIDAIPNSGRYDGIVGVLGGLEAIRALQESGFQPQRSIELVVFTSEEPTRFGIGCLGSRLLCGNLKSEHADDLRDQQGSSLREVRRQAGFGGSLQDVKIKLGQYRAFVELHIEQGPILERERLSLGVVTHIAAPAALRVLIEGEGGHAGSVLMPDRRDAFLAAAELALGVEAAALSTGSVDTVGTTGVCEVFPGAVNSIPTRVKLEVDVRDTDLKRRDAVLQVISQTSTTISEKRRVRITSEVLNADAPAACDSGLIEILSKACEAEGCSYVPIISRAYHDSLFMSRIAPTAMLFIPCRAGISHRPDEFASLSDIANGTRVLANVMARLAS